MLLVAGCPSRVSAAAASVEPPGEAGAIYQTADIARQLRNAVHHPQPVQKRLGNHTTHQVSQPPTRPSDAL